MDIVSYILSKKYTDKSLIGGGAIKGKNCTINSITAIDGGHRVTFGWTLDDGTEETGYMDVMDGADGSCEEIVSVVIDNNNHFIVTYSDGTTHDCGIINIVNERELTKAQYDALSNAEKMNGTTYYVTDEDGDDAPVVDVVVNGQSVVDENGVARIVIASRIQSDWNQDDSTQQDFIKNKIKARNAGTNNNTIIFHEITPGTEFAHVVEGAAQSFVEGTRNSLLNNNGIAASLSHVEGTRNVLYGASDCHAEGYSNQLGDPTNHTYPLDTHIEGSTNAILKGTAQHAEGHSNIITDGYYSHVEGARNTVSGSFSHAEGQSNTVSGGSAHAEGYGNTASGNGSHTEGDNNRSTGPDSHTEGVGNLASASGAHAEGQSGTASGINSHAEGKSCEATGYAAHAEGNETHAVHDDSHAEGAWTWASGQLSHAEGSGTVAAGYAAHSGGDGGAARGRLAFIHGDHLEVLNDGGAAFGKANAERDTTNHPNDYTIFAVGNGTISEGTVTNRANAFELRSDNTGYVGGQQIVTTTSLNTKANAIEGMIAPQFVATQAYAIGDIVTHNDGLYKFKTAHTANDSWNAAEVDQINISDNIGGGGSSVSVQSLQVSGDKLATITVSGVNHDIYSPNSKTFTMAVSRANIESGETYSTIFGKIKKWFSDLPSMFVSKSGDTMTGPLTVQNNINCESSDLNAGWVYSNAYSFKGTPLGGQIDLVSRATLGNIVQIEVPQKNGTMALTSDIPAVTPHVYSSTEAEVGTWIDGTSKVYEITLTGTCPGRSSTGYAELPSGVSRIISWNVVCYQGGTSPRFYQLPYITVAGLQYSTQVKVDTHNGTLCVEIMNGSGSDIDASWTYTAIVRYIKTSS